MTTDETKVLIKVFSFLKSLRDFVTKISPENRIPLELSTKNPQTEKALKKAQKLLKEKRTPFSSAKDLLKEFEKQK